MTLIAARKSLVTEREILKLVAELPDTQWDKVHRISFQIMRVAEAERRVIDLSLREGVINKDELCPG